MNSSSNGTTGTAGSHGSLQQNKDPLSSTLHAGGIKALLDKANKGHHDFVFPPEVKARNVKRGVLERAKYLIKKKLALKKSQNLSFSLTKSARSYPNKRIFGNSVYRVKSTDVTS